MTTRTRSDGRTSETTSGRTSPGQGTADLGQTAGDVAGEAGRALEQKASQGMTQVGDTLRGVAQAARQTGDNIASEQPQIGRYLTTAATKLDEAATYVTEHEPAELIDRAQVMARRQPALVIGAGMLAGVVIGRLLKTAGGPAEGRTYADRPYGRGVMSTDGSGVSSGYGTGYGASYASTASGRGSLSESGSQDDPSGR
jgi:ElaB/YqjD/DUF883 family membrane-anchored ribosome-binding protein